MQQQAPPQNRKTFKEQMNQRAEEMFLNPDANQEDESLYQLDKISLDSSRFKSRNSLERFDERQQVERGGSEKIEQRSTNARSAIKT
ncbi:MAG: hypothetical protein QM813_16145 [Verrucomicrobiota bacterium]